MKLRMCMHEALIHCMQLLQCIMISVLGLLEHFLLVMKHGCMRCDIAER